MLSPVVFEIKKNPSVAIRLTLKIPLSKHTHLPRGSLHLFIGIVCFTAFLTAHNSSLINSSLTVLHRLYFPSLLMASVTSSLAACSKFPLTCFPRSTLQLIHSIVAVACFFHSFAQILASSKF